MCLVSDLSPLVRDLPRLFCQIRASSKVSELNWHPRSITRSLLLQTRGVIMVGHTVIPCPTTDYFSWLLANIMHGDLSPQSLCLVVYKSPICFCITSLSFPFHLQSSASNHQSPFGVFSIWLFLPGNWQGIVDIKFTTYGRSVVYIWKVTEVYIRE